MKIYTHKAPDPIDHPSIIDQDRLLTFALVGIFVFFVHILQYVLIVFVD